MWTKGTRTLAFLFYTASLFLSLSFRYLSPIRESPAVARCSSLNNRLGCLVFLFSDSPPRQRSLERAELELLIRYCREEKEKEKKKKKENRRSLPADIRFCTCDQ